MRQNEQLMRMTIILGIILTVTVGVIAYDIHNANASVPPSAKTQSNSNVVTAATPQSNDKDTNGCYTPATVREHYGETACVDYIVGYVYETSAGTKFIDEKVDYYSGFVGYIPYYAAASNINLQSIDGKKVKVSGYIQEYNGYPEIVINDLSQVGVYQ